MTQVILMNESKFDGIHVVGYDQTNADVLRLNPLTMVNAMCMIGCEIECFHNPFKICRFDLFDVQGFVCRINIL